MLDIDLMNHTFMNMHFVLGASDPGSWLDNGKDLAKDWGAKFLAILGFLAFCWGGWYLFCAIVKKSNAGRLVGLAFAAVIVGAILCVGGISWLQSMGNGGFSGVKKGTNG